MSDIFSSSSPGIGIDMTTVSRFTQYLEDRENSFIRRVFTQNETGYCFSYKNADVHLAGIFALKEATSKALGIKQYPYIEIEVRHDENGAPEVWHNGQKLTVKVSISHTDEYAIAIAAV